MVPSGDRQPCSPSCSYADFDKDEMRPKVITRQDNHRFRVRWRQYGTEYADGWLYSDGNVTAYVYQDFRTAIMGRFTGDRLVKGRSARVTAYRLGMWFA